MISLLTRQIIILISLHEHFFNLKARLFFYNLAFSYITTFLAVFVLSILPMIPVYYYFLRPRIKSRTNKNTSEPPQNRNIKAENCSPANSCKTAPVKNKVALVIKNIFHLRLLDGAFSGLFFCSAIIILVYVVVVVRAS